MRPPENTHTHQNQQKKKGKKNHPAWDLAGACGSDPTQTIHTPTQKQNVPYPTQKIPSSSITSILTIDEEKKRTITTSHHR